MCKIGLRAQRIGSKVCGCNIYKSRGIGLTGGVGVS